MDRARSNVRRMSAFCEGGSGALEREARLVSTRHKANTKRIGCMVNV